MTYKEVAKDVDSTTWVLAMVIVIPIIFVFHAWLVMLGLGILHIHLSAVIPAVGFKAALWTSLALGLVFPHRVNVRKTS